jgi:hypothetical protein
VLNHLELANLDGAAADLAAPLSTEQRDYIQQLAYRYEQLERKENSDFTNKMFGVDLAHELVLAVKNYEMTQTNHFKIQRYNPQFNGYHFLLNTSSTQEANHQLLDLSGKYDCLSNGRTLNMYQRIRN